MTKQSRLGLYADIREILDAVLASGGGTYACPSHGHAVHWRQRAYKFRKAYAAEHPSSPYECIVLPRIPAESPTVTLTIRQQIGTFTPLEGGTPVLAEDILDDDPDGLLAFAKSLAGPEENIL